MNKNDKHHPSNTLTERFTKFSKFSFSKFSFGIFLANLALVNLAGGIRGPPALTQGFATAVVGGGAGGIGGGRRQKPAH